MLVIEPTCHTVDVDHDPNGWTAVKRLRDILYVYPKSNDASLDDVFVTEKKAIDLVEAM